MRQTATLASEADHSVIQPACQLFCTALQIYSDRVSLPAKLLLSVPSPRWKESSSQREFLKHCRRQLHLSVFLTDMSQATLRMPRMRRRENTSQLPRRHLTTFFMSRRLTEALPQS